MAGCSAGGLPTSKLRLARARVQSPPRRYRVSHCQSAAVVRQQRSVYFLDRLSRCQGVLDVSSIVCRKRLSPHVVDFGRAWNHRINQERQPPCRHCAHRGAVELVRVDLLRRLHFWPGGLAAVAFQGPVRPFPRDWRRVLRQPMAYRSESVALSPRSGNDRPGRVGLRNQSCSDRVDGQAATAYPHAPGNHCDCRLGCS